jgi:hypothetical protein
MALLHIPLAQITQAHLQALKNTGAAESRTIDYKRDTYGPNDNAEFLADASSFANTSGGDIVIGVAAKQGVPTAFAPLTIDLDQEQLRFEECARTGLEPRLPKIDFHRVPVTGGSILIIRIPRSFNAPHRVIRQNSNRFWARSSGGKYQPNVDELRQLFLAAPQLAERIRNFRIDRIAKIAADQAPVRLMNRGTMVIHIVPLGTVGSNVDLPLQKLFRDLQAFSPISSRSAQSTRINFDGILKLSNADQQAKEQRAYVQLYHSGAIEAVISTIRHPELDVVFCQEDNIVGNVWRLLRDLGQIRVQPPYGVLISFVGVLNGHLNLERAQRASYYEDVGHAFDQDQYHFSEVIFDAIPLSIEESATVLRPILDQIANSAGEPYCRSFRPEDGRYIPLTP